jgi:hypothetical protein
MVVNPTNEFYECGTCLLSECTKCHRTHKKNDGNTEICEACSDGNTLVQIDGTNFDEKTDSALWNRANPPEYPVYKCVDSQSLIVAPQGEQVILIGLNTWQFILVLLATLIFIGAVVYGVIKIIAWFKKRKREQERRKRKQARKLQ